MLFFNIISNRRWKWPFLLLIAGLFFLVWIFLVKPYTVKRLQFQATQTANKLVDGFSSRSLEDLAAIEQLFLSIETKYKYHKTDAILIDDLNTYFNQMHGLESFILPPRDMDSALIFFNPYIQTAQKYNENKTCERALKSSLKPLKAYKTMTLIPIDGALCVYDPKLQMFAVLNLKTALSEHLKKERMRGYFLALLEDQLPALMPAYWQFSRVHSRFFSFLGTEWKIHVYPSGAYVESSFRRAFFIFCTMALSGLGLLGWWFLRRRVSNTALDPNYVAHLKQLALFDGVTNLPNRRHCLDHLNIVLKRAKRTHTSFSVCFMDCDKFKKINDTYGHSVGDQVLRHISDEVSRVIRDNDFFARFSGDEFCLILEDTTANQDLDAALNKILKTIATPIFTGEHKISVTMSIGVSVYPAAGQSADSLLRHADKAMYLAKRNQKNTYIIYQP
ncbi:MAG: GGDEF domain-containing protein [Legionella sp.]|nr:GGDEF domain-containing protein [Legionella sp.]